MQLQLSLKIADRLHHDLLVRGEPLDAAEAAKGLLCTSSTGPLPTDVLDVLVREDRRFCWAAGACTSLALSGWQHKDHELSAVPFVALDLETTGAKAGLGKITEIGAVRIEGLRPVGEFHSLVNPQRPIPPMITRITGISESMVADAPRIEDLLPELLAFLDGAIVVAHNAPFDVGFLNYELHRLRSRRLGEGAIDTLPLSRALVPGLPNYRLGTVAEALGSPVQACHRALEDAQAVAHVLVHLAGLLQSSGLDSLCALRQHGRQSGPPALEKLALTRDLPDGPGVYVFVGEEEKVLLTGSANGLAKEVRALFVSGPRRHRGLRVAARSVRRIDHEPAATPLEALVREHELALQHRPPHNPYRAAPENYVYIRAGGAGPGLALSVTRRALRAPAEAGATTAQGDMVLGPYRRRSSALATVGLLQQCYPIRHCPKAGEPRPCERGRSGDCLSPCTAAAEIRDQHDRLVAQVMHWLSGSEPLNGKTSPLRQAKELVGRLRRDGDDEAAGAIEEAAGHLLAIRRASERLAEASRLDLVLLWPQCEDERRTVRMNLVLGGLLREATSLHVDGLEGQLTDLLAREIGARARPGLARTGGSLAVGQETLDLMLAVRRWLREDDHMGAVIVPLGDCDVASLAELESQLVAESRALLTG